MVFSRVFSAALAVVLLFAQGEPAEATSESQAVVPFLLISPSVRVNGMGQAGVALPDEPAGYYNPGAAALSSPVRTLQSRFYLSEMPWLVETTYNYFAAQAAAERVLDGFLGLDRPTRLRAAFYGYRTKIDFGELPRINEIGTFTATDASNNIGVSLALRSVVEVGIGATTKWISSKIDVIEGSAKAYDFGLLAVVPMVGVLERLTGRELTLNQHLRPQLDIGFGVAWQNRGGETITYTDQLSAYPLPVTKRHGWSGSFGMDWRSDSFSLALGRVTFSQEIFRRTYYSYKEDAYVPSPAEHDKSGVEVSIMETVSIRRGTSDGLDGDIDLTTSGWTVKSDGLFKIIAHFLDSKSPSSERDALQFLARRLSISWSRFENNPAWLARSHSFIGLSF